METVEYKCPKCNSDNIVRFSVAYNNGTSNVSLQTKGSGVGIGTGGVGVGVGSASTTGTAMSNTAQIAAPPRQKSVVGTFVRTIIIYSIIGVILNLLFDTHKIRGELVIEDIIFFVLPTYLAVQAYKYNKNVYPNLLYHWQHSWICNKCGHIFEIDE